MAGDIHWSDWNDGAARRIVDTSPHRDEFYRVVELFCRKCAATQTVEVFVWSEPHVYVEVRDARWKHYPCDCRALVSWDADNGKWASHESGLRYAFARRGWGRFLDALVGYPVLRYTDCGQPGKTTDC
jgi:hypothetical protein